MCQLELDDLDSFKKHIKSDFHQYNLKQKLKGE